MNNQSRLEQLRLAIHGVKAPFFSAGEQILKSPVALRFKDGSRFVVDQASDRYQQESALQPLISRCRPAMFGDRRQNRLDRSIRDAMQLMAGSGNFSVENFDPESTGILDAIRREMLPIDSPALTAELYALNIYTTGGHFASHKDTPRGKDMLGTLIVCLPTHFWRGQLTLTHRGLVQQFDWGEKLERQRNSTEIHWAAFYGDVDHQIERVGMGARVTLTYLLRRDGQPLPSRTLENAELPSVIEEEWHKLLADAAFLPEGGVVGYPCCHLYHQDARLQIKQESLDQDSTHMLKGRDQLVAVSALHAGLAVTFAPYLFETCVDETWHLDRFPTNKERKKLKREMDLPQLESALPIVGASSEKGGDFGVTWLEEPPSSSRGTQELEVGDSSDFPVAGRLHSCEYCEWGYFGNEASSVDFYIYAALHVVIPSIRDAARARLLDQASATPEKKVALKITRAATNKSDEGDKSSEYPEKNDRKSIPETHYEKNAAKR